MFISSKKSIAYLKDRLTADCQHKTPIADIASLSRTIAKLKFDKPRDIEFICHGGKRYMYTKLLARTNLIFNNKRLRIILNQLRYPIFLFILILLLTQIQPSLLLPGLLVSLFGELIQIWSFASLDKNQSLATKGPYSLMRNPMYIGRFFVLGGCLLLIGRIWILLLFTVIYYFYMINRVKREESLLHGVFGDEYKSYCSRVKRFVPSFRQFDWKSLRSFKWKLLVQNHGHWNFAGVIATYLLFYLFTFIKSGIR